MPSATTAICLPRRVELERCSVHRRTCQPSTDHCRSITIPDVALAGDEPWQADRFSGADHRYPAEPQSSPREVPRGKLAGQPARSPSLYESLQSQLNELTVQDDVRQAADWIIGQLSPEGFLDGSTDDFPSRGCPGAAAAIAEALHVVQRLEPAGVGARDLRECLLLQLDVEQPLAALLHDLIDRYLPEVAAGDLSHLAQATGYSRQTIDDAVAEIRRMRPCPHGSGAIPGIEILQRMQTNPSAGSPACTNANLRMAG